MVVPIAPFRHCSVLTLSNLSCNMHFPTILPLLAASTVAIPTSKKDDDWSHRKWDAVIVGAGTAGIIVADRLSEAGLDTLLLELGGASYGITGGRERPNWLDGTSLSRVDVPGLCESCRIDKLLATDTIRQEHFRRWFESAM